VCLYILTKAYHVGADFVKIPKELAINLGVWGTSAPVLFLESDLPQTHLPRLYKSVNAMVIPSRGEGWGRPHAEAMAMGLPVLATNWSGNTEFMNEYNSYLIKVEELITIQNGAFKGHRWAQPSVNHLRKLMRLVFSNPIEAKHKGDIARRDMVTKYNPKVVANIVLKRLLEIYYKINKKI